MGRKLQSVEIEEGVFMEEKACENYKCVSCGKKMISVNFVNGICIQVFATHKPECDLYTGTAAERTVEVTCESCVFYDSNLGCSYTGDVDDRMSKVRL